MTKESLTEKLDIVRKQRDEHFAIYQQAVGALGVLEHLLSTFEEKDHLTMKEFGDLVGGEVEAIEAVDEHKDAA